MSLVRFETTGRVGVITVNNPPLNLMDDAVMEALNVALSEAQASDIRGLLLRAEGDHFGCGVNVGTTFAGVGRRQAEKMLMKGIDACNRLENWTIPIVCAVQGMCLAAALELALRCDVIIAADTAQFAQVEQHIGATTYLGGAYLLAERCGPARAREICFTGDMYDAASFERWNIVNKVVPRASLHDEAMAWATRFANGPTLAHGATKRMIRAFLDHGVRAADAMLLDLGPPLFDSRDFQAGVQSVVEHGSKNFRGKVTFNGT